MKGKNQNNSKKEWNKTEESGESCDEEVLSEEEIGGDYICICDDDQDAASDSSCSTDSYWLKSLVWSPWFAASTLRVVNIHKTKQQIHSSDFKIERFIES